MVKSELYYNDYSNARANNDNPLIIDHRDSNKFDRNEWYEVLAVINAVSRNEGFTSVNQCRLIECLIREKLPMNYAYNRGEAIIWLINNYRGYHLLDHAKVA